MDASGVITAFRKLPSRAARAAAFDALIRDFDRYEWRAALATIKHRIPAFSFDIVGSLPAEIVIQIFSFLEISDSFRLQCVSRRWRVVLSSCDIHRGLLPLHEFDLGHPQTNESPVVDHDYADYRKLSELLHRCFRGETSSSIHFELPPEDQCPITYDYFGDTIAWSSQSRSCITALNLRSGRSLSFTGQAREKIQLAVLSSQLVMFFTFTGVWYACNLITGQRKSFRLPSARKPIFSCRAHTIAGVLIDERGLGEHTAFVWDFDSQKCRTFEMSEPIYNSEGHKVRVEIPSAVLVDPTSERILICFIHMSTSYDDSGFLFHQRYNYTGILLHGDYLPFPSQMVIDAEHVHFKPTGLRGRFALFGRNVVDRDLTSVCFLRYDELVDQFQWESEDASTCWLKVRHAIRLQKSSTQIECRVPGRTAPIRLLDVPPDRTSLQASLKWRTEKDPIQVNISFIALTGRYSIHVWTFDKDIELPRTGIEAQGLKELRWDEAGTAN